MKTTPGSSNAPTIVEHFGGEGDLEKGGKMNATMTEVESRPMTPRRMEEAAATPEEIAAAAAFVDEKEPSDPSPTDPHAEHVQMDEGPIPDGGYGWIIVVCQFVSQMATWGMVTTYGVFISWFASHPDTFPGATPIQFGWIAGLLGCVVFIMSPFSNWLCKVLPLKVSLLIAQVVFTLGLILSGFTNKIWQLTLTQGLLCGLGTGLNFMATQPLISQWFLKRRAVAMGLSTAGVGAGGLLFSITTRLALATYGVRYTYIINGLIVFVMLTPTTLLFRPRMKVVNPRFHTVQWHLLANPGLILLCIWSFFVMFGYLVTLFSVASYTTLGLGESQAQGAVVQAVFAAGQLVGRPALGLLLDRFGRIRMAALITLVSGLSCLCVWIVSHSFGVLLFFAFVNGIVSGIFFSALAPLLSEVIPLHHFSDALSIIWLFASPIILTATPIAFGLNAYSRDTLGKTGTDQFLISIGVAGGAHVVAAVALWFVKFWERKDHD